MKRILYILKISLVVILFCFPASTYSQMPTDGNYSNWDWEDQTQENWKKKDGNYWIDVHPPFKASTARIGEISKVYETSDYTKEKGWSLLWAQFDNIYPYFILYNHHKAMVRAFFYTNERPFEHVLATLSYSNQEVNTPGVLSFGNRYQLATDKYLTGNISNNDMISVIIPFVGARSWCSADFPMLFDNNIQNSRYDSKKWEFKFYGCENYEIKLQGRSESEPASTEQQTLSGSKSSISANSFAAEHAKLHKQLKTNDDFMQQLIKSTNSIDSTSPSFLKSYKEIVKNLKPLSQVFSAAVGISSAAGAVLGFLKVVTGTFEDQNSTKASAVIQHLNIEGSMSIKFALGGNTLKIPGVNGTYFPYVEWNPYDCPMGIINLEKTPSIMKTGAYDKFQFDMPASYMYKNNKLYALRISGYPDLLVEGAHNPVQGYLGKFVKYKFNDDNIVSVNNIPGLSLIDINFALVFKLIGTESEKFDITRKRFDCPFWSTISAQEYNLPIDNPLYKYLEEGSLKIYKYDIENNEIYIGTPELPMNKLKGMTIEIPEKTEIALRVIAKFNSDIYDKPVIFQGHYSMNIIPQAAQRDRIFGAQEQMNFPFSDYYGDNKIQITLSNSTSSSSYYAKDILIKPGYVCNNGFLARGVDIYPTRGNTRINNYNFNCYERTRSILEDTGEEDILSQQIEDLEIRIYPNPGNGIFTIEIPGLRSQVYIEVYNSIGKSILNARTDSYYHDMDISNEPPGIYIIKIIADNKIINKKVIKQ